MRVGRVHRGRTLVVDSEDSQRSPEQRLCMALIEDAVKDLHGPVVQKPGVQEDAKEWLMGRIWDHGLSFAFCCEHLGLNPEYIQRLLGLRTLTLVRFAPRMIGRRGI
jgi:hypothetical protein